MPLDARPAKFPTTPLVVGCATLALLVWAAPPRVRGLLGNTTLLAAGVCGISLPLGAFLGLVMAKINVPGRRLLWLVLGAALFVPLYVFAGAWQAALGYGGWATNWLPRGPDDQPWLQGWPAAVWIHAAAAVPWAALLTAVALRSVERSLEEQSLIDADGWHVVVRVSLRRAAGGLFAAGVWIAAQTAAEITITDLFQVRTFAEEAYIEASLGGFTGAIEPIGLGGAEFLNGAAVFVTAALIGVLLAVHWFPPAALSVGGAPWQWTPSRYRWIWTSLAMLVIAVLYALPLASLAWKAGLVFGPEGPHFSVAKATRLVGESPVIYRREVFWSLVSGLAAAIAATSMALALAWAVRIFRRASSVICTLVAISLATPGPLLGVATIAVLNQPNDSPLHFFAWLYDHTLAAPIAVQTVRALPLAVLFLWSQLATLPQHLLDAARSEGAGRWRTLLRIVVPLRAPAIIFCAAATLLVATAETAATLLVAPPGATLLSVRVFGLLHYGADDQVAAICLAVAAVLTGFSLAAAAARRLYANHTIE